MLLTQLAPQRADSEISPEVSSYIKRAFFGSDESAGNQVIHAAFLYHFQNSGGCTRMKLTYQCASLLGISFEASCSLAACVECLHNASLIQDDLQDHSSLRRGSPTVALTFGADVALGLTNRLITSAFVCLAGEAMAHVSGALIRKVHQAVAETIDGQTAELIGDRAKLTFNARLASSAKKSGPLFSLALELPLIMAGEEQALDLAHQAAMQFGLGYQIMDDLDDQERDASAGSDGNLVIAMGAPNYDSRQSSVSEAVELARNSFHDAAAKAGRLPHSAGRPLIDLINRHLPLLGARSH